MRTYAFAPAARRDLQSQIDYLNERNAFDAADRLVARVESFLAKFLIDHPQSGLFLAHRDLWEIWIPRTRLVLWYRFTDNELQVAGIWHTSQDRHAADF